MVFYGEWYQNMQFHERNVAAIIKFLCDRTESYLMTPPTDFVFSIYSLHFMV